MSSRNLTLALAAGNGVTVLPDVTTSPNVNQVLAVTAVSGNMVQTGFVNPPPAAGMLPLAGGTMTGPLALAGNATLPLHAVPLQQVNSASAGGPFLPTSGGIVTGSLSISGSLSVSGALAVTAGYLTDSYNANAVLPPAGNQSAIAYNYQNIGEVDYWNCGSPAATSHVFWQLSSGVATRLMDINNGGRVQAYGGLTSLGAYFVVNYNASGVIPVAGAQAAQAYNYLGGAGEIDYWNCSGVSSVSHTFWQRTSGGAATRLMDINSTGQVTAYNGFALMSPTGPNIRSGIGAASGTQPKGSLWLRTDGGVGSTLYVSQGAGTWNAVAAV